MVNICINYDKYDCIREVKAFGHSGRSKHGLDIVCSAVSVLLRTTAQLTVDEPGIDVDGRADRPGDMFLKIKSYETDKIEWLRGISSFLISGVKGIAEEYPENCIFELSEF